MSKESLDRQFINLAAGSLERLRWSGTRTATCRCPFCGDSKKRKSKTRGYFFARDGGYLFKCHNCGISMGLLGVLEKIDPSLAQQYRFSWMRTKAPERKVVATKAQDDEPTPRAMAVLERCLGQRCDALPTRHPAVQYLSGRGLPRTTWGRFRHCEDFRALGDLFEKRVPDEPRLVIPFHENGRFVGLQGRSYDRDPEIKYITLKVDPEHRLVYGIDDLDLERKFYVLEGPIDSMLIPNACATQSVSNMANLPDRLERNPNAVFVPDNQPMNREVCALMDNLLRRGKTVVVWPRNWEEKDVNDMVGSRGISEVMRVLSENAVSGLQGQVCLTAWRRCGRMERANGK